MHTLIDYSSTIWDNVSEANLEYINRLHKITLKLVLLKVSTLTVDIRNLISFLSNKEDFLTNAYICIYNIVNGTAPKNIINTFTTNPNRHITFLFSGLEIIYSNQGVFRCEEGCLEG